MEVLVSIINFVTLILFGPIIVVLVTLGFLVDTVVKTLSIVAKETAIKLKKL